MSIKNMLVACVLFSCFLAVLTPLHAEQLWPSFGLEARRARYIEDIYVDDRPSVSVSAAYQTLNIQQRVTLGFQLRGFLLAQMSPGLADPERLASLSCFAQEVLAPAVSLVRASTTTEVLDFMETSDLDHLLPLPPEAFGLTHRYLADQPLPSDPSKTRGLERELDMSDSTRWTMTAKTTPGYVFPDGTACNDIRLLEPCDFVPPEEVPEEEVTPGPMGFWFNVAPVLSLPAYTQVNSNRLARAFNEVCNFRGSQNPLFIRVGTQDYSVRTPRELIQALDATGRWDIGVYDARMCHNLTDYWVRHGEDYRPVRFATWFALNLDPADPESISPSEHGPLLLPADHSEHQLVLWKRGTTEIHAMVKWYMGVTTGPNVQGLRFHGAVHRTASWVGCRVLYRYSGAAAASRFATAAKAVQQYVNFVKNRFDMPIWGYVPTVACNDATGMMESVLRRSPEQLALWGLVRSLRYEFYMKPFEEELGLELIEGPQGLPILGLPSDAWRDAVPWAQERRNLLCRLGASIPWRETGVIPFGDVRAAVDAMSARSASFRRALSRK